MEKIEVLGKSFPVVAANVFVANGTFFSVQAWSTNRIYSLTITQSEAANMGYNDLLNNTEKAANAGSMRGASVNHIAIVDTNFRRAILAEMHKTQADFDKAVSETDDTFFAQYDALVCAIFVNKNVTAYKVTLDVATLTDGVYTSYKSVIGDKEQKASSRDVWDFKSGLQKSVLSAAADILAGIEDDQEEEK